METNERQDKITHAAIALMDAIGGRNQNEAADAILDVIENDHRSRQQTFWSVLLRVQTAYAANTFDDRNEAAVQLANKVKELAKENNWDLGLPRI